MKKWLKYLLEAVLVVGLSFVSVTIFFSIFVATFFTGLPTEEDITHISISSILFLLLGVFSGFGAIAIIYRWFKKS